MSSSQNVETKGHVLMIPFPAQGHMLPLFNLAHQLAIRGVTVTIWVSPKNLSALTHLLSIHPSMQTLVLPLPPHPSIPAGVENLQELHLSFLPDFRSASEQLYEPISLWFKSQPSPPVAIISDVCLASWTLRLATDLGIKRLAFSPVNANTLCWERKDEIEVPAFFMEDYRANLDSWGVIINSFNDLERHSLDELKTRFFKHDRVWAVGPLLRPKIEVDSQAPRHEALAWLDSCPEDGCVVFVGFGSQITLTGKQMEALASALEMSGVRFIWSIKEPMKGVEAANDQNVVPAGFEDRVAGRGLLFKGWAPQVEILGHPAVGAYLTHCGWNSVLEGLCAGVLLLTWPMQADHFSNLKLLVDEWGVAIPVCEGLGTIPDSAKVSQVLINSVDASRPERVRASELNKFALGAMEEGGSSCEALDAIVKKLFHLTLN